MSSVRLVCRPRFDGRQGISVLFLLVGLVLGSGYKKYNGVGAGATLWTCWFNSFRSGKTLRMPARPPAHNCVPYLGTTASDFSPRDPLLSPQPLLKNAQSGATLNLGACGCPQFRKYEFGVCPASLTSLEESSEQLEDMVAFLPGCSVSLEGALEKVGVCGRERAGHGHAGASKVGTKSTRAE